MKRVKYLFIFFLILIGLILFNFYNKRSLEYKISDKDEVRKVIDKLIEAINSMDPDKYLSCFSLKYSSDVFPKTYQDIESYIVKKTSEHDYENIATLRLFKIKEIKNEFAYLDMHLEILTIREINNEKQKLKGIYPYELKLEKERSVWKIVLYKEIAKDQVDKSTSSDPMITKNLKRITNLKNSLKKENLANEKKIEILSSLGRCYKVVNNIDESNKNYHEIINLLKQNKDDKYWWAKYHIAHNSLLKGNTNNARMFYREIIEDCKYKDILKDSYLMLAISYKKEGNLKEAEKIYNEAIQKYPDETTFKQDLNNLRNSDL